MEGCPGAPSPSQERRAEVAGISSTSGVHPRGGEPPGRKCLLSHRAGRLQEGETRGEKDPHPNLALTQLACAASAGRGHRPHQTY